MARRGDGLDEIIPSIKQAQLRATSLTEPGRGMFRAGIANVRVAPHHVEHLRDLRKCLRP